MTKLTDFDPTKYLETPEDVADFIEDAIETGDPAVIKRALDTTEHLNSSEANRKHLEKSIAQLRAAGRKPSTVGAILAEEFLQPLDLTVEDLAGRMGVEPATVSAICSGRDITGSEADALASALGTSPEFWLNIQAAITNWRAVNE
ncbi:HigA family addiction module antitoxin [Photobacterium angustum]|uniref:HigA family addiction module antitoxin n=1 Tax=Photobacterium angustum TaxID=661 RepID=UPI0009B96489|nr:HigA family addiction module antitoxin [Photobacterium angustum]PSV61668.1 addiction module antidote protein, HigA family [Photobacterium angustum]